MCYGYSILYVGVESAFYNHSSGARAMHGITHDGWDTKSPLIFTTVMSIILC